MNKPKYLYFSWTLIPIFLIIACTPIQGQNPWIPGVLEAKERSQNKRRKQEQEWIEFRKEIRSDVAKIEFGDFSNSLADVSLLGEAIENALCSSDLHQIMPYLLPEQVYAERIIYGQNRDKVIESYKEEYYLAHGTDVSYNLYPISYLNKRCGKFISGNKLNNDEYHLLFRKDDVDNYFEIEEVTLYYCYVVKRKSEGNWYIEDVYHYYMPASIYLIKQMELHAINAEHLNTFLITHHYYNSFSKDLLKTRDILEGRPKKLQDHESQYTRDHNYHELVNLIKWYKKNDLVFFHEIDNPTLKLILSLDDLRLAILMGEDIENKVEDFYINNNKNIAAHQMALNMYRRLDDKQLGKKYAKILKSLTKDNKLKY